MIKFQISFINDKKDLFDELGYTEKDLVTVTAIMQSVFSQINSVIEENFGEIEDLEDISEEICKLLHSSELRNKIDKALQNLITDFESKFMILALLCKNSIEIESWLEDALNITEKISWDEFRQRVMQLGEPALLRFIIELFLEIFMRQNKINCIKEQDMEERKNIEQEVTIEPEIVEDKEEVVDPKTVATTIRIVQLLNDFITDDRIAEANKSPENMKKFFSDLFDFLVDSGFTESELKEFIGEVVEPGALKVKPEELPKNVAGYIIFKLAQTLSQGVSNE